MRLKCKVMLPCLIMMFISSLVWSDGQDAFGSRSLSSYQLNSGDLIKITVFGEEDMTVETRLSDAGTISYPILGEIQVKGMTLGTLEQTIKNKLKGDYLINPKVNASIIEYRKFFVNGEVKNPGGFSFEPGLTMEKAIALAGGFTERASKKDILVARDVNGVIKEHKMTLGEKIIPGDVIKVKESFF